MWYLTIFCQGSLHWLMNPKYTAFMNSIWILCLWWHFVRSNFALHNSSSISYIKFLWLCNKEHMLLLLPNYSLVPLAALVTVHYQVLDITILKLTDQHSHPCTSKLSASNRPARENWKVEIKLHIFRPNVPFFTLNLRSNNIFCLQQSHNTDQYIKL